MAPPFHPDQLGPGSQVGPWRVVASLGAGGFGRVFKVERAGRFYSLKMALRPAGLQADEEEDVNGRLAHEVAALLACSPHPHIPRVQAVDRWPEPPDGYLYFVTDFIDGETFHEWRWRVKPTAAHLLSVFTEVVRVVADLHRRGVHHRDLKGDNVLIRREDERPFLIDLGTVRLPGAAQLTVGIAPGSPHLLPPECVSFLRQGTWLKGAYFDAGVPGDLYALGMLLYESLTDGYAFDPKLPYDTLLPAIETVVPRPPHVVNPKVPRALGDIALRLLEKRPEDRYSGTEALLQALWEVAKEKRQPAWRVSLDRPEEAETSQEEGTETPRFRMVPELPPVQLVPVPPAESREPSAEPPQPVLPTEPPQAEPTAEPLPATGPREATPALEPEAPAAPAPGARVEEVRAGAPTAPVAPPGRVSLRAAIALGAGAFLVLGLLAFGLSRLVPSPGGVTASVPPPPAEKGSAAMPHPSERTPDASTLAAAPPAADGGGVTDAGLQASVLEAPTPLPKRQSPARALGKAAVALCAAGACATASGTRTESPQKDCPDGASEVMQRLRFRPPRVMGTRNNVSLFPDGRNITVPVPPEGPLTLYVYETGYLAFPKGSRFHGQLFRGKERVFGWITELELPDGQRLPICANIVSDPARSSLGMELVQGSTPERPLMYSTFYLSTTNRLGKLIGD